MPQSLLHVALVVREYDEAIAFFCGTLGFTLVEDTYQPEQDKRWVVVAPPGSRGTSVLLARATTPEQTAAIGNQSGGRVFLFLETDNFDRDYQAMRAADEAGIVRPRRRVHGLVREPVGPVRAGVRQAGTARGAASFDYQLESVLLH